MVSLPIIRLGNGYFGSSKLEFIAFKGKAADLTSAPIGIIPLVMFLFAWPKPHMIAPVQKRSIKELE